MKELLEYLLDNILGRDKYQISENIDEATGRLDLAIETPKENVGLIIGKEGKTIKSLRNILTIKATLEKKMVNLQVVETEFN